MVTILIACAGFLSSVIPFQALKVARVLLEDVAVAAVVADRAAEQAGTDAQPWPSVRWRGRFEAHFLQ